MIAWMSACGCSIALSEHFAHGLYPARDISHGRRETETGRQRQKRDRYRENETYRHIDKETDTEGQRQRNRDRRTERQKNIETETESKTKRQKQRSKLDYYLYQLLTQSVTQEVKEWVQKTKTKNNF